MRTRIFIKTREQPLSVTELEEDYGFKLPPIFKTFICQFEGIVGDVYLNSRRELQTLTYCEYRSNVLQNENLFFEDFIPVENIFKYSKNSESWVTHGVVPISQHSHGGTILLGISEANLDKLYFEYEKGIVFIEDNIFSFLKNLNFVLDFDGPLDKLYKKWDEDFWRIED